MDEFTTFLQSPLGIVVIAASSVQFILSIYIGFAVRSALREHHILSREMFGVMRKIEGLTAHRREIFMRQYEKLMDSLSARLPTTISAHASEAIFETESKILKRLAELEPHLADDEVSKRKMDDLIASMEKLDKTIVALTSDTVRKVMLESREQLFDEPGVKNDVLDA